MSMFRRSKKNMYFTDNYKHTDRVIVTQNNKKSIYKKRNNNN